VDSPRPLATESAEAAASSPARTALKRLDKSGLHTKVRVCTLPKVKPQEVIDCEPQNILNVRMLFG
jgi:hypothetical protein